MKKIKELLTGKNAIIYGIAWIVITFIGGIMLIEGLRAPGVTWHTIEWIDYPGAIGIAAMIGSLIVWVYLTGIFGNGRAK